MRGCKDKYKDRLLKDKRHQDEEWREASIYLEATWPNTIIALPTKFKFWHWTDKRAQRAAPRELAGSSVHGASRSALNQIPYRVHIYV